MEADNEMLDSGYSQAPSSNLSPNEGYMDNGNDIADQTSTRHNNNMEVNGRDDKTNNSIQMENSSPNKENSTPYKENSTPFKENSTPYKEISNPRDEECNRVNAQPTSQSTLQLDNNGIKKKSDGNRSRSTRRHSAPSSKVKTSSADQKDATMRKRRERRRGSNQSDTSNTKPVINGSRHRSSLDMSSATNGQNIAGKRTRYSLPSKLSDLDDSQESYDRIGILNSRLNSRVDSCLDLVDCVLQLNAAVFDPEQEEVLQAKLKEISASLSDEPLSGCEREEVVFEDEDKNAGDENEVCNIGDDDRNIDKVNIHNLNNSNNTTVSSLNAVESTLTQISDSEKVELAYNTRNENQEGTIPASSDNSKTEESLTKEVEADVKMVDDPGCVIVSEDDSESDLIRDRLDTVAEETEDHDTDAANNDATDNDELSNLDIVDSKSDERLSETDIIPTPVEEGVSLHSALPANVMQMESEIIPCDAGLQSALPANMAHLETEIMQSEEGTSPESALSNTIQREAADMPSEGTPLERALSSKSNTVQHEAAVMPSEGTPPESALSSNTTQHDAMPCDRAMQSDSALPSKTLNTASTTVPLSNIDKPSSLMLNPSGDDPRKNQTKPVRKISSPSSPTTRKISIDELLELDNLQESIIDDKFGSPIRSPVRRAHRIPRVDSSSDKDQDGNNTKDDFKSMTDTPSSLLGTKSDLVQSHDLVQSPDNNNISELNILSRGSSTSSSITDNNSKIPQQSSVGKASSNTGINHSDTCSGDEPMTGPKIPVASVRFTRPLTDTLVLDGDAVRFDVTVTGSPIPTVKWYRSGKALSSEDCEISQNGNGDWSLVIRRVTRSDEGRYKCVASNAHSTAASKCYLKVTGK